MDGAIRKAVHELATATPGELGQYRREIAEADPEDPDFAFEREDLAAFDREYGDGDGIASVA